MAGAGRTESWADGVRPGQNARRVGPMGDGRRQNARRVGPMGDGRGQNVKSERGGMCYTGREGGVGAL